MNENQITAIVVNRAVIIHKNLGPGLLESVYEAALAYELNTSGLKITRQVRIPLKYNNVELPKAYVADIIVNDLVILEIKAQEKNNPLHSVQLLSYLKIANKKLGLVLNFGMELMREGISRVVNDL